MKILRVSLSNLNSLEGEHVIDFESGPLAETGIFAITGPTGAGKSTLLDAITLALYGKAARYAAAPNPADMMSRHTGECRAEVDIEVPAGRFRAVWHLHRSRNKADGKIQTAKRYIYDRAGNVLTQKLREADEQIERLCGLDYDRFMRSVLLAQGDFARFLKAKADDRAELLESLTGTVIYSELSELAHREQTRRTAELQKEELKLGLIKRITPEERDDLENRINALERSRADKTTRRTEHLEQLNRARQLREQLKAESDVQAKQSVLAEKARASAEDLARLADHGRAWPFVTVLAAADHSANHRNEQQSQLTRAESEVREANRQFAVATLAAVRMADEVTAARSRAHKNALKAAGIHAETADAADSWLSQHAVDGTLDTALSSIVSTLTELKNQRLTLRDACAQAGTLEREQTAESAILRKAEATFAKIRNSLETASAKRKAADEALESIVRDADEDAIENHLTTCRASLNAITQIKELDADAANKRAKAKADKLRVTTLQRDTRTIADKLNLARRQVDSAGNLLEARREHLTDARKVADYEKDRPHLAPGSPCPLCGATHHPFAEGTAKPPEIKHLETKIADARQAFEESETLLKTLTATKIKTDTEITALGKSLADHETEAAQLDRKSAGLAASHKIIDTSNLDAARSMTESAVDQLEKKRSEIKSARAAAANAENAWIIAKSTLENTNQALENTSAKLRDLGSRLDAQRIRIDTLEGEAQSSAARAASQLVPFDLATPADGRETTTLNALKNRRNAWAENRDRLRASKDALKDALSKADGIKEELSRLTRSAEQLRAKTDPSAPAPAARTLAKARASWTSLDEAENAIHELEKNLHAARATVAERKRAFENARHIAETAATALTTRLQSSSFVGIPELRAAILDEATAKSLVELRESLENNRQVLIGQLQAIRESIAQLRKTNTAEGDAVETIETSERELASEIEDLTAQITTLRDTLRQDDENRRLQADGEAALENDRARLKIWSQLHALIGSHDGGKFRRFAQGLSLDLLVRHANTHMERLSDRYKLRRNPDEELELEIIDHFQADVVRPMSSLSGGESFLASLALALGLSDLASNVQIDSLFIDEGFGSLDADTLDIAISALDTLRARNKTIGVVSHVELLKERISTQIVVEKNPDATSRLRIEA